MSPSPTRYRPEGQLNAASITKVYKDLEVFKEGPVEIDLRDVKDIDYTGAQLLYSFRKTMAERGHQVSILWAQKLEPPLTLMGMAELL